MSVFTPHSKSDVGPIQLDLFTCPPTQVACLKQYYEVIRPISQFQGYGPIQFQTSLQGDFYTDLSKSKLFLKCRLLKPDGSSFSNEDSVTPVNLFLHALFSEVDVRMNDTLVASSGNMYAYTSYFQTLLRSSAEEKKNVLTEQLYMADTPGWMDSTDYKGGNFGLFQRHTIAKGSKLFEIAGPILSECLMFDRYLLNGVKLDITLKRSSPKFCLMSDEDMPLTSDYKIVIEDAFLRLYKLKINPGVLVAHNHMLKKGHNAMYPYIKRHVKSCTVPPNQTLFTWGNLNEFPLPKLVAIAFCQSEAVAGSYKKNPWNFINCDVKQLSLSVNGVSWPKDPIQVDYSMDDGGAQILQVFDGFYDKTNKINAGLSRGDVAKGFAVYLFHLDPDYSENAEFPLVKSGEMSINVRFGTPLNQGVCCLFYTEKMGLIEFDEMRSVKIN
jgi:hypothetical protein